MADFVHPKDERGPLIYMALMLSTFLLLSQRGSPLRGGRPRLRQGPLDRHRAALRRQGAQDASRTTGTSVGIAVLEADIISVGFLYCFSV